MPINYDKHILPLLAAKRESKDSVFLTKYLGCSFFINSSGFIATCAHVINSIEDDEYIVAKHLATNKFYPLGETRIHPKLDFAVSHIEIKDNDFFQAYTDEILIGIDIGAFGFTASGFDNQENIGLDGRFLKGYITRIADNFDHLPDGIEACETSFPSLSGFSGTPILNAKQVVGMLFNNYESHVVVHSYSEIQDNDQNFSEKITRVVEFGLAYSTKTLVHGAAELKIPAFV